MAPERSDVDVDKNLYDADLSILSYGQRIFEREKTIV